ncbi:hypothetical protein VCR17J2_890041 [Vibrio coralliirubri]|nr:hypothetical protein VCR17J2_890041 [Vibrio coralliirubri]
MVTVRAHTIKKYEEKVCQLDINQQFLLVQRALIWGKCALILGI